MVLEMEGRIGGKETFSSHLIVQKITIYNTVVYAHFWVAP